MRLGILLLLAPLAVTRAEEGPVAVEFALQERTGFAHHEKREWDQAIAAFEKQIAIFALNPSPYYNIACCYPLQGKADRAATWLTMSIDRGWRDLRHLERDPDFDKVRDSAGYPANDPSVRSTSSSWRSGASSAAIRTSSAVAPQRRAPRT